MDISTGVALITGGASGLGRATVDRFIADGAKVVIVDLPTSAGDEVFQHYGPDVSRFAPADVRDPAQIEAALDLAAELGDLRMVVNCAGTGDAIRTVGKNGPHPLDRFQRVIEINLIGTFNVIRLAAARMAALGPLGEERGVIINTASIAAFDGQIGQAAYSASKAGIAGMTLPIARDLAQSAIRVVTIAPGLFQTPLLGILPPETIESLGRQVPHPSRLGQPAEFAALAAHIVANPMLNGETIRLDGAIRMAPR